MAVFNAAKREIDLKIVYYGPAMCCKTTNVQCIHKMLSPQQRGDLMSLATKDDRTLFFDFLPIELGDVRGFKTRFHIYTVPGQVYYALTRRAVLTGADGVVFVADSQANKLQENIESFKDLCDNLKFYKKDIATFPLVMQYNKRDLPNLTSVDELNSVLNSLGAPCFESSALTGMGVVETLTAVCKIVLKQMDSGTAKKKTAAPVAAPQPAAAKPAAAAEPDIRIFKDQPAPEAPKQPAPPPKPEPPPVAEMPALEPEPEEPSFGEDFVEPAAAFEETPAGIMEEPALSFEDSSPLSFEEPSSLPDEPGLSFEDSSALTFEDQEPLMDGPGGDFDISSVGDIEEPEISIEEPSLSFEDSEELTIEEPELSLDDSQLSFEEPSELSFEEPSETLDTSELSIEEVAEHEVEEPSIQFEEPAVDFEEPPTAGAEDVARVAVIACGQPVTVSPSSIKLPVTLRLGKEAEEHSITVTISFEDMPFSS